MPHQWVKLAVGRVCLACCLAQAVDEFDEVLPCAGDKPLHAQIRILLIEDDTPVMRVMAQELRIEGFNVRTLSKRGALEFRDLEGPDVAVFNMKATATEKTAYNRQLRMLNPNCIIIDVDEFVGSGESVRDSGADSYTARPAQFDAIIEIIREQTALSLIQRTVARDEHERELRPEQVEQRDVTSDGE